MLVEVRAEVSVRHTFSTFRGLKIPNFVLRPKGDEHQGVCNDASGEDSLHLRIVLHNHGLAILDNRRLQIVTSG